MVTNEGGTGRLYPRVIIDMLPDNVLLETFEFYLGKEDAVGINYDHNYDEWQTLVHVCRRWRCIVFASPRRLDLKLYCSRQRSVNSKTLDIWPAFPIVIFAEDMESKEDVANVIATLGHHNRVCKIYYLNGQFQDSFLKEFAAIGQPFPALTSLELVSFQGQNVPVFPDSFLGGCAPRLRSLHLDGIPYPSIGKLLSSATNLVRLSLCRIPHSGYVSSETIVPFLSTLSRLESLALGFQHPRPWAHRASRHPPPLTRVFLPILTFLDFRGDIEYLEDILSKIETPILNQSYFYFFNQLVFDTPLLGHFIHRTKTFMTIHTACVEFSSLAVWVTFLGREEMSKNYRKALHLEISCKQMDWQLSALAQVLDSFLSSLPTLDRLEIGVYHEDWRDEIEVTQWREFLHLFTSVTKVNLESKDSVQLGAPAHHKRARRRGTKRLSALPNPSSTEYPWRSWGSLEEAIKQFIASRKLYGHPVTVYY